MKQSYDYSATRAVRMCIQRMSYRFAILARTYTVCACLGMWMLVCVAMLNDGPVLALTIVAGGATLVGILLYSVINAQIRVQSRATLLWSRKKII